jgi:hypothetical protein
MVLSALELMWLPDARSAKGRQVGIYILPGFNSAVVTELKTAFTAAGIIPMVRANQFDKCCQPRVLA